MSEIRNQGSRAIEAVGSSATRRFAFFTHDTFGLGHLRRTLRIATEIARRDPSSAILIVTGSSALRFFEDRPLNVDVVKIPTIVRPDKAAGAPPHLPLSLNDTTALRSRIACAALTEFAPDVFLVDNFLLGSRKELLPALEALKAGGTRIVGGLRDIIDKPEIVRENWQRDGIYEAMDKYFTDLIVFGCPDIFNPAVAYEFSAAVSEKLHYCGYVTEAATASKSLQMELLRDRRKDRPLVIGTVGGGGDGFPVLDAFIGAVREIPEVDAIAVTGPLMNSADSTALKASAANCQNLHMTDYIPELPALFKEADLVVSMGGYNTSAELLAAGCKVILIPRTWSYGEHTRQAEAKEDHEQLIRAQALDRLNLARCLHPADLSPERLCDAIKTELGRSHRENLKMPLLNGAARAAEYLMSLVGGKEETYAKIET